MTAPLLRTQALCVDSPEGRPLIRELSMSLGRDRVALIGRNGVGKSSLLRVLAGELAPERGSLSSASEPILVRQDPRSDEVEGALAWLRERGASERAVARDLAEAGLASLLRADDPALSRGQARKLLLLAAKHSAAPLLLLDEPSEDLDDAGLVWLRRWLANEPRGLLVVTHDKALLRCFHAFFLVAESGCRYLSGSFDEVLARLEREQADRQRRYAKHLGLLAERERANERIQRRRARKQNVGRLHELRRCTPRSRLNQKRGYAQVSQARVAKIREERITAVRTWAKATRRALRVELPLRLRRPQLAPDDGRPRLQLDGVGVRVGERSLFAGLDLALGRERVAVLGPNGAGKTTLLRIALGELRPSSGAASCDRRRIGVIAQGASDWRGDDSLLERLAALADAPSLEQLIQRVLAHEFPLALAERPLRSLSPGERVRAALICLFAQAPQIDLLVLDEPTYALDFVGVAALTRALRAWPGGLLIVSHDRDLIDDLRVDRRLILDGRGGHRIE